MENPLVVGSLMSKPQFLLIQVEVADDRDQQTSDEQMNTSSEQRSIPMQKS